VTRRVALGVCKPLQHLCGALLMVFEWVAYMSRSLSVGASWLLGGWGSRWCRGSTRLARFVLGAVNFAHGPRVSPVVLS